MFVVSRGGSISGGSSASRQKSGHHARGPWGALTIMTYPDTCLGSVPEEGKWCMREGFPEVPRFMLEPARWKAVLAAPLRGVGGVEERCGRSGVSHRTLASTICLTSSMSSISG